MTDSHTLIICSEVFSLHFHVMYPVCDIARSFDACIAPEGLPQIMTS